MTTIETVEALDKHRSRAIDDAVSAWVAAQWGEQGMSDMPTELIAAAIRQSDERAGLVTVPRVATEAMRVAGKSTGAGSGFMVAFEAMSAASPFAQPPGKE